MAVEQNGMRQEVIEQNNIEKKVISLNRMKQHRLECLVIKYKNLDQTRRERRRGEGKKLMPDIGSFEYIIISVYLWNPQGGLDSRASP